MSSPTPPDGDQGDVGTLAVRAGSGLLEELPPDKPPGWLPPGQTPPDPPGAATAGSFPTLEDVKEWLGLDPEDTVDDTLLLTSLDAAIAAQYRVCSYPLDDAGNAIVDPDLYEAVLLRTQRYAARRSSPEGVVGITGTGGDFAAARLPSTDADIVRLEGPWLKIPVA